MFPVIIKLISTLLTAKQTFDTVTDGINAIKNAKENQEELERLKEKVANLERKNKNES